MCIMCLNGMSRTTFKERTITNNYVNKKDNNYNFFPLLSVDYNKLHV